MRRARSRSAPCIALHCARLVGSRRCRSGVGRRGTRDVRLHGGCDLGACASHPIQSSSVPIGIRTASANSVAGTSACCSRSSSTNRSERRVTLRRGDLDLGCTVLIDRPRKHWITRTSIDRDRFTGDRCLIDRGVAAYDLAVDRNAITGEHLNRVAGANLAGRDLGPGLAAPHARGLGCQRHQTPDRVTRSIDRSRLDQLGHREQHGDHGRFGPLADRDVKARGNHRRHADLAKCVLDPCIGAVAMSDGHDPIE